VSVKPNYPINSAHRELDSMQLVVVESVVVRDDARFEVVMAELVSGGRASQTEIDEETHAVKKLILENTESAIIAEQSKRFKISWDSVASYLVTDELTGCPPRGTSTGRLLSEFSESPFLDYAKANFVKFREEPWRHFRLYGTDRIVDVLAHEQPEIERIGNFLH
jgi:hypothetical protein